MKSFGRYIAKHLVSFTVFVIVLLLINAVSFGWTFHNVIIKDYGDTSPQNMLEEIAEASNLGGISENARQKLESNHIGAMFLNPEGQCAWSVDTPEDIPDSYTAQDIAVFPEGILRITLFSSGTLRMACWYWAIRKTAIPNSQAITFPSKLSEPFRFIFREC